MKSHSKCIGEIALHCVLMILCMTLAGCGPSKYVKPTANYTPPSTSELTQKVPLRVALYLAPSFRNYVFQSSAPVQGGVFTVDIGEAMCTGAQQSVRTVFKEVNISDELGSNIDMRNIDATITPEIVDANLKFVPHPWYGKNYNANVSCKWTITRPDGRIMYVNTFSGSADCECRGFKINSEWCECMGLAVKDQYDKLISDLLSSGWLDGLK